MAGVRAAIFRGGELVVDEVAAPVPAGGQAVVDVLACGICGSDLHFVHQARHVAEVFERTGSPFVIEPDRDIVMGHEFCAEIVESSGAEGALPVGTRVCSVPFTIEPPDVKLIGFSADRPGGYGERMVLNEATLIPVPNGLSAEHAALTEPMAVGWHAIGRARIQPDDVALVIGCGPIGLGVIAGLKIKGVHRIVAADFNPHRRAVAEAMGADVVIDPAQSSPYAAWKAIAEPEGFDPKSIEAMFGAGPQPRPTVIFECVGVPGMVQRCFEGALKGSRVVVVGVCMEPDRYEPLFPLQKELDVIFTFFYDGAEFQQSLQHIADGLIDVTPMVSGTVGLDGVADAFRTLAGGGPEPSRAIKIIVDPRR